MDIPEGGSLLGHGRNGSAGSLFHCIVEVGNQGIARDVYHIDVVHIDVFHHSAAATCALEAQPYVRTDKGTVRYVYIPDAAGHLAAYHKTAMPVQHGVVLYQYIFARLPATAAVGILARLDADSVVARIEQAVGYHYVPARLHVERIAILRIPGVEYLDIVQGQVFARKRVQTPTGRVTERNAFQQHAFALDKAQQYGAQPASHALPLVLGYLSFFLASGQDRGFQGTFVGIPYFTGLIYHTARFEQVFPLPLGHLVTLHRPPAISRTVEYAVPRNGYVLRIHCRNGCLAAKHIQAFERGRNQRI